MDTVTFPPTTGLRRAVGFLTPFGGAVDPASEAVYWFPVVGAVLGLLVGGAWWAASLVWSPLVAAVIALAVDFTVTGMLHLDGLCDAADGLLAPMGTGRRLQVMASPDIGAFGLGVGATIVVLRVACLAALSPSPVLVAGLWAGSRTAMAAVLVGVPYARPGGLAAAFRGTDPKRLFVPVTAGGAALALLLVLAWRPIHGPLALVALAVASGSVVVLARRRIGGFTGDVLGAIGMVGETVGLLIACGVW
ncbi:MAG: adenosylcobinamide-GDP ribazoletransferase [Acidimicrobiales bacterium]